MTNLALVCVGGGSGTRFGGDKLATRLGGRTVFELALRALRAAYPHAPLVVVAPAGGIERWQAELAATFPDALFVAGGVLRQDSVRAGVEAAAADGAELVAVHDAARPLVRRSDIEQLISRCLDANEGGILACRVRDTMKRGENSVAETVSREHLWHALTPQFFPTKMLRAALHDAIQAGVNVTDEASAMEWAGHKVLLIEGHSDNIKITQPADLALAAFYLEQTE